jgi:CubicO group peptidase (beta-lactamase class C family)
MKVRRQLFIILAVALLLAATPVVVAPAQESFAWIGQMIRDARPETGAPGISVSVVHEGELVWAGADGVADVENQVPAKPTTVYRIGSITKTITAVAVMQLVEAGQVGLDDTLEKWVPYYPVNRSSLITLRHVLTHTSGIRHYHYERGEKEGLPPQYYPSLEAASNIYSVAEEPLLFTPGTDFCYSSYASRLLGEVIERASGITWEAYIKQHIFEPAGMNDSRVDHPLAVIPNRSRGYRRAGFGNPREGIQQPWPRGARLINAPFVDLSYKEAAAAVLSSVEDLARYDIALNEGVLLKQETLEQMYTPYTFPDGTPGPYGLHWRVSTDEKGRRWISHGGGVTGHNALLLRYPEGKLSVAILTNLEGARGVRSLAMAIAERLLDEVP